jgi:hypothetical protein
MALPEAIDEFTFSAGLREEQDQFLQADGFTTLHNCYQDKAGALVKLPGYDDFAKTVRNTFDSHITVSNIGTAPKLIKRGELIGAVSNGYLYAKTDKWTLQGTVSPFVSEQRTVLEHDATSTDDIDSARSGNWIFTIFTLASGATRVAVRDISSGETVATMALGSSYTMARAVKLDDSGRVAVLVLSGTNVKWFLVTPDTVSGGVSNLLTSVDTFDACYVRDAGNALDFVYVAVGDRTANEIRCYKFSSISGALTQIAAATAEPQNYPTAVCVTASITDNRVAVGYVGWQTSGGLKEETFRAISWVHSLASLRWGSRTLDTAPPAGVQSVKSRAVGVCSIGADGHYFVWASQQTGSLRSTCAIGGMAVSYTGTLRSSSVDYAYDVALTSKPWWDGTRVLFAATYRTSLPLVDRHHYVLGTEPNSVGSVPRRFVPFGHLTQLGSRTTIDWTTLPGAPVTLDDGSVVLTLPEAGGQGGNHNLIRSYTLMVDDRVGVSAGLGACTYVVGAMLSQWDGLRVLEAGWLHSPRIWNLVTSGTGLTGDYSVCVTFARYTATGELVRSRPSAVFASGALVNQGLKVQIVGPQVTALGTLDKSPLFVEVWRTKAGGATFFRSSINQVSPGVLDYVEFTTAESDATLEYGEQLYTDGASGELANDPPISPVHVCEWRNRLWLTDGERIGYSKEAVAQRGAEFSLLQTIEKAIPQALTAVAPHEEVLAVFSKDSTAFVYGDAPAANGSGSTLVGPVAVQGDLGCTYPAGIVAIGAGLMVPTRYGIQLFGPKRSYSRIGASVERTMATYPRVRDACTLEGTSLVWFACTNAAGSSGLAIVFDYEAGTWGTAFDGAHCSTISVSGGHIWTDQDGYCNVRGTEYLATQSEYSQQIETPWFKPAGLAGQVRARRFWALMRRLGTSDLKIEIAYDFSSQYKYALTIGDTELSVMEGAPSSTKPRIPFPRQVCQAFRLRVTEMPGVLNSSAGFAFAGVRLHTAKRLTKGVTLAKRNTVAQFAKDITTNEEYVAQLSAFAPALVTPGLFTGAPDAAAYSIDNSGSGMTVLMRIVIRNLDWVNDKYTTPEGGQASPVENNYCNFIRKYELGGSGSEWELRLYNKNSAARKYRMSGYAFSAAGGLGSGAYSQPDGTSEDVWNVGEVYHVAVSYDPHGAADAGVSFYVNGTRTMAPGLVSGGGLSTGALYSAYSVVPTNTASPIVVAADSPVDAYDFAIIPYKLTDRQIADLALVALKEV